MNLLFDISSDSLSFDRFLDKARRSSVALAFAAAAVLGACAAPSSDGAGSDTYVSEADIAAADANGFKIFTTREEAIAWLETFRPMLALHTGTMPGPDLPGDHELTKQASELVRGFWPAMKTLYPERTRGLPEPMVIVFDDDTVNAFAVFDSAIGKQPHVLFVHRGLLEKLPEDEEEATMAHELGHHVLAHGVPGTATKLERIYRVTKGSEPFGFEQTHDAETAKHVNEWRQYAALVGGFAREELASFPMPTIGTPFAYGVLAALRAKPHANADACERSDETRNGVGEVLRPMIDAGEQTLTIPADARDELVARINAHRGALRDCLADVEQSFIAALAETAHVKEEKIRSEMKPEEVAAIDAPSNIVDQAVAFTGIAFDHMRRIEADADLASVRIYTTEEEADEVSVNVLAQAGKDPTAPVRQFLSFLEGRERTSCEQKLATGAVPAYGVLSDAHHSTCFRAWHAQRYAARFHPDASKPSKLARR